MPTLYILCGPSGCGKSTWASDFMKKEQDVRYVSRDEIRFHLVKEDEEYFSREKEVYKKFVGTIAQTLVDGFDVIADATHLNEFSRRKLTQAIDYTIKEYSIIYVVFTTPLEECIAHNANRTGRACVPESVIRNMYRDYKRPTMEEDERVIAIYERK